MGAKVPWRVRVLRLVEDEAEVYAVTGEEAIEEAEQIPGVAKAIDAKEVQ